jgi:alpha-ribazole phosphatase
MVRMILARHGETAWNAVSRYQGQADVPLNDAGRRQAAALARRLAQEEIHAIYASDLQRVWETVQVIAASRSHSLTVRAEPRLREMDFGDWEGLTYAEILERDPQNLAAWETDPVHIPPPGGETVARVAARVQSVIDDISRANQDKTVLLVAHGGPLRVLLCLALGLDPKVQWQFRLDIAALSELEFHEAGVIVNYMNDTKHLVGKYS